MLYRPNLTALSELTDLLALGNIKESDIQNTTFYREVISKKFLDLSNIKTEPKVLILMVDIATKSLMLEAIDITGNNTHDLSAEMVEILASSKIQDIYISPNPSYGVTKIVNTFITQSHVTHNVTINGFSSSNITAAETLDTHNSNYFAFFPIGRWIMDALSIPHDTVKMIHSYLVGSPIQYSITYLPTNLTGGYECNLTDYEEYVNPFKVNNEPGITWCSSEPNKTCHNGQLLITYSEPSKAESIPVVTMPTNNIINQHSEAVNIQPTQQDTALTVPIALQSTQQATLQQMDPYQQAMTQESLLSSSNFMLPGATVLGIGLGGLLSSSLNH